MDIQELLRDSLSKKIIENCENITESQAKEMASSLIEEMEMESEPYTPAEKDVFRYKCYDLIDEIHCFTGVFDCDDTFSWLADINGRYSEFKIAVNSLFEESLAPFYIDAINKLIIDFDFMQEYPEEELQFYRAPLENKAFLDKMIFNAYDKGELFWKNEFQYIPRREKEKRIEHLEKISETIPELKNRVQCFLLFLYDNLNSAIYGFYDIINFYDPNRIENNELYAQNIVKCFHEFCEKIEQDINQAKAKATKLKRREKVIEVSKICINKLHRCKMSELIMNIANDLERFDVHITFKTEDGNQPGETMDKEIAERLKHQEIVRMVRH